MRYRLVPRLQTISDKGYGIIIPGISEDRTVTVDFYLPYMGGCYLMDGGNAIGIGTIDFKTWTVEAAPIPPIEMWEPTHKVATADEEYYWSSYRTQRPRYCR